MTFGQIKQALLDRLGNQEFSELASTTVTVERIVNEATQKIASAKKWIWLEDAQKSIAMVGGTKSYFIDDTISDLLELIDANGAPLSEVARDTFEDLYRADTSTAANPTRYTVDGMAGTTRKIGITVWPTPSESSTVTIRGNRRVADMSSDSDVPEIPDELHHLIVDQAIALLREFEESPMAEFTMIKAGQGIGMVVGSEKEGQLGDKT